MNTFQLSEAKARLGRIADEALAGRPSLIVRNGKLLQLVAFRIPETEPRPPGYFAECYTDQEENRRERERVGKSAYRKAKP